MSLAFFNVEMSHKVQCATLVHILSNDIIYTLLLPSYFNFKKNSSDTVTITIEPDPHTGGVLMPTQITQTVRRWKVCYLFGFIPYPCRRAVTIKRWCYNFHIWIQNNYIFLARHSACEIDQNRTTNKDRKYVWWGWGFGLGKIVHLPQTECFDDKLDDEGECDLFPQTAPAGASGPHD